MWVSAPTSWPISMRVAPAPRGTGTPRATTWPPIPCPKPRGGGIAEPADAGRCPREDDVTGIECDHFTHERDEPFDPEDHVPRRPVLHRHDARLASRSDHGAPGANGQRRRIGPAVGGPQGRAQRGERG